jgi:hypothetical protein
VIGHEQRVHEDAVAEIVPSAESLAFEAEALVQPNRRLVPGEDMELELGHAASPGPCDRGLEKPAADAAAAMAARDHHPEIGNVQARRVRVPGKREASDDTVAVDRDQHRRVGMATHGLEVAALVGDGSPSLGGQQPSSRLLSDCCREGYELGRVRRLGGTDRDHATTTTP